MLRLVTHSPKIPRILSAYVVLPFVMLILTSLHRATKGKKNAAIAIRKASTTTGPKDPVIPGNPPLPPSSQQTVFDVKIPDAFYATPEPPVQVVRSALTVRRAESELRL